MAEARGTPLVCIVFVLTAWTSVRVWQYDIQIIEDASVRTALLPTTQNAVDPPAAFIPMAGTKNASELPPLASKHSTNNARNILYGPPVSFMPIFPVAIVANPNKNIQPASADIPRYVALPRPKNPSQNPARGSLYGYSFWRWGAQNTGLAPAGQYGGSQSGLIATYRLADRANAPALLWRVSVVPHQSSAREFAFGTRIQPIPKIPVTLSVERRFSPYGPDRFAAYLAGGLDDMPLPGAFKMSGYGQVGLLAGHGGDRFFDGTMQVTYPLHLSKQVTLNTGGGVWAGGQRGAARVDIGPTLRADIALGQSRFRLSADWRLRAVGDAKPGSGPAITVSTGF